VPETEIKLAEPIALFDLDGTLADFDEAMQQRLAELRSPGEDPRSDDVSSEEVHHVKARYRLVKSQPGFWRDLATIPLGFQILEEARAQRFLCQILSKSPRRIPAAAKNVVRYDGTNFAYVRERMQEIRATAGSW
jgi:5'-nucleotidase